MISDWSPNKRYVIFIFPFFVIILLLLLLIIIINMIKKFEFLIILIWLKIEFGCTQVGVSKIGILISKTSRIDFWWFIVTGSTYSG